MSLKLKVLLYINLLLLITMVVGLFSIILVAKKNVREEVLSTQSLALFAIESSIKNNSDLFFSGHTQTMLGLSNLPQIRHLNIAFIGLDGSIIDATSQKRDTREDPPTWFRKVLEKIPSSIETKKVQVKNKKNIVGYVHIKPELIFEYAEIWQQIILGFYAIGAFVFFVNILVSLSFSFMIKPINNIIKGFESLEKANYKVRIEKSSILELDIIGKKFNSMVVKLGQSNKKIHKLSQDLILVREQEKKELARNLHDQHGQVLTAIQVEAESIKKARTSHSRNQSIESIIDLSKNMMLSTRTIIKNLSLGLLDDLGFELSIIDLIENWKKRFREIHVSYSMDKNIAETLSSGQQAHIFRIIQEALTNITKHANAKNVSVNIKTYGFKNRTRIEIINDGVIHDAKHKFDRGIGLMSIEERVSELNGRCKITISHLFKIIIELGAKK